MRLSTNFTLNEFTKSQTATRNGIDNTPSEEHLENIKELVENILQPLRDELGPIRISSGYRSKELNTKIGGSATSQHSKGQAADIECSNVSNKELGDYIKNNLEFDQLIYEFLDGTDHGGWIHVSYNKNNNRKTTLRAFKRDGRTVYESI